MAVILIETRETIIDQIEEDLSILAGPYPINEMGNIIEDIAGCFQGLGICNLLLSMDVEGIHRNLILSGYTRRYFLKRTSSENNLADEHLAISRTDSFFDAVAADAFNLANEIVSLSPDYWIKDGEYEDDFCFHNFFYKLIGDLKNPDKKQLTAILHRFENTLQDSPQARLNICKAFLDPEPQVFNIAFEELILEWEREIEKQRIPLGYEITFEPRSKIFIIGLAILRIAEKLGIVTQYEYSYCPNNVRIFTMKAMPNDIYNDIEDVRNEQRRG